jgi:hypothetical protein
LPATAASYGTTGDKLFREKRVGEQLRPRFPDLPGARALVDVAVDRVSSSCGFGVPLMEFVGPRTELPKSAERKGEAKMAAYRARKNAESIDGLPGLEPPVTPKGH